MARKPDSDSEKTYATIVAAADTLLANGGPGAISFRRVAAASGLSVGTVGYYFPERAQLLEACMTAHTRRREELICAFIEHVRASGATREHLEGVIRRAIRLAFADREYLRLRALASAERRAAKPVGIYHHALPHLLALSALLERNEGIEPGTARLAVQSVNFLIARYAEMTEEETCEVAGKADPASARSAVEEHLCHVAMRLLWPGSA